MQEGGVYGETDLQTLLSDERSLCNQYKQIYQDLKQEHKKLQEELVIIHKQLKDAVDQSNSAKASSESYIKKLESVLAEKQEEICNLNKKVANANPDEIRQKIQNEERKRFDELLSKSDAELDDLRELYNKCIYENTVLKSKLEFSDKEHERAVELLKVQHMAEVSGLNAKIGALQTENQAPVKSYSDEFHAAEKEVMQLTSRLNVMRSECSDLRARNTDLMQQLESQVQIHAKQLGDQSANIKSYESEKEVLSMRIEVLRNEVSKLELEKSALRNELQGQKHEVLLIRGKLEESLHKYNVDVGNLKLSIRELHGEHDSSKEQMKEQAEQLKTELAHANQLLSTERRKFADKEDDLQKHLVFIKQQMFQKCREKDQALEKMEFRLKEVEISKNEELNQMKQQQHNLNQQLLSALEQNSKVEHECVALKSQLESNVSKNDYKLLEDQMKQNSELNIQVQSLKENIQQLLTRHAQSEKFQQGTDETDSILQHPDIRRDDSVYQELSKLQITLEQQKFQYQQRINSLESQIREQQSTWSSEKNEMQTKLRQYGRLITKLREKLDVHKAHIEELEAQNEILQMNVPLDEHLLLKKKLSELQQKQEEFHQVMITALPLAHETSSLIAQAEGQPVYKKLPPSLMTPQTYENEGLSGDMFLQHNLNRTKQPEKKTSSIRKSAHIRRASSRRVADYTSSSDVENL